MSIPSGKPAHDPNPLDRLDEIQARYMAWHSEGRGDVSDLELWTHLDRNESMEHCIVRNDVPALVAALRGVEKLLAEYEKDDREHLRDFGQHHPYAGWAADHLRAAFGEARP